MITKSLLSTCKTSQRVFDFDNYPFQSDDVAREDWGDDGDDAQGRHAAQMEALQRLQVTYHFKWL